MVRRQVGARKREREIKLFREKRLSLFFFFFSTKKKKKTWGYISDHIVGFAIDGNFVILYLEEIFVRLRIDELCFEEKKEKNGQIGRDCKLY